MRGARFLRLFPPRGGREAHGFRPSNVETVVCNTFCTPRHRITSAVEAMQIRLHRKLEMVHAEDSNICLSRSLDVRDRSFL